MTRARPLMTMTMGRLAFGVVALTSAVACKSPALHEARDFTPVEVPVDAGASTADFAYNACGGQTPIAGEQGTPCGPCGFWVCDGTEALRCSDSSPQNACGTCGVAPLEICNGIDDDCDGVVDPGCPHVLAYVDQYTRRIRVAGGRVALDRSSANDYERVFVSVATLPDEAIVLPPVEGRSAAISADYLAMQGPVRVYSFAESRWIEPPMPLGQRMEAPALDGDRVAFVASSPTHVRAGGVFVWQVGAATLETVLDFDPAIMSPVALSAAIAGDWVVYEAGPNTYEDTEVYAFHRATKELRVLSAGLGGKNTAPAIAGTRVVWMRDDRADDYEGTIYLYDLATDTRTTLDGAGGYPRISGTLVCYEHMEPWPNGGGVRLYDLATGKKSVVASDGTSCDIDGTRVAWLASLWMGEGVYTDLLPGS